jgi:acetyl esterase/lipase
MASPKTLIYKTVDKVEVPLDIYLPKEAKNVPVLLWFHGGGLLQGKRTSAAPHMLRGIEKYKYALISADYRLAPQVGVAEIYEDVKDCIAFIRTELSKHVGDGIVDANRLAVCGSSAGGYLAFLAGLYVEPKPKVILPIYPITDPLGLFFTTPQKPPFGLKRTEKSTVDPFLDTNGEVVANNEENSKRNEMYMYMLQEANLAELLHVKPGDDTYRIPKKILEKGLPPTYVVMGDADEAVGCDQVDEVVGAMAGLGVEFEYERLAGVNHLFDKDEKVELERLYMFMMEHV